MASQRITFEGPAALAVRVATALADAGGVELTSSEPITKIDERTVRLGMTVDGDSDAVADAVAALRGALPPEATLAVEDT